MPDEVHLLATCGNRCVVRHPRRENSAAHRGLHIAGNRAERCHVLLHLRHLVGLDSLRRHGAFRRWTMRRAERDPSYQQANEWLASTLIDCLDKESLHVSNLLDDSTTTRPRSSSTTAATSSPPSSRSKRGPRWGSQVPVYDFWFPQFRANLHAPRAEVFARGGAPDLRAARALRCELFFGQPFFSCWEIKSMVFHCFSAFCSNVSWSILTQSVISTTPITFPGCSALSSIFSARALRGARRQDRLRRLPAVARRHPDW